MPPLRAVVCHLISLQFLLHMLLRYICLCLCAYAAEKANAGVVCFVNCNCCVYICLYVAYTHVCKKEARL